jgi:hypothetical protein
MEMNGVCPINDKRSMIPTTRILFVGAIIFAVVLFASCSPQNEVIDSSFENKNLEDGPWQTIAYDKEPGVTEFVLEKNNARSGSWVLTIINHKENHSRVLQGVPVEPQKTYRLSGYIKTTGVGESGRGANLSIEGINDMTRQIHGTTKEWQYVEMYIRVNYNLDVLPITVELGGYFGTSEGKATFDDIDLREVKSVPHGSMIAIVGDSAPSFSRKGGDSFLARISRPQVQLNIFLAIGILALAFLIVRIIVCSVKSNAKKEGNETSEPGPNERSDSGME